MTEVGFHAGLDLIVATGQPVFHAHDQTYQVALAR